jgi:hypothetical protein
MCMFSCALSVQIYYCGDYLAERILYIERVLDLPVYISKSCRYLSCLSHVPPSYNLPDVY